VAHCLGPSPLSSPAACGAFFTHGHGYPPPAWEATHGDSQPHAWFLCELSGRWRAPAFDTSPSRASGTVSSVRLLSVGEPVAEDSLCGCAVGSVPDKTNNGSITPQIETDRRTPPVAR
jgi:hypothetical protein